VIWLASADALRRTRQLVADKRQVVWGIGIVRLKADGLAEMLPRRFRPTGFFQHASEIEVG